MISKVIAILLSACCFSLFAYELPTLDDISDKADSISDIDLSVLDDIDIDDVTDLSNSANVQDNVFSAATEYVNGATANLSTIKSDVSEALSASSVDQSQKSPISITKDITKSYTQDIKYQCVKYKFLGLCWWIKTSFPWAIGTNPVAQNFQADLQVEVTSRPPSKGTSTFTEADNAPTDTFSGAVIQNVSTALGRTLDLASTASVGNAGVLQFTENQSQFESNKASNSVANFKEAMVIGNPSEPFVINPYQALPGYCNSTVLPYTPIFNSVLDLFSWRILATTDSILMGVYAVKYDSWNMVGNSMGSVFPRIGYIETGNEFDATVTTAYRALSIARDNRTQFSGLLGLHVYSATDSYASGSWSNQSDYEYRALRDHTTQLLREYYPEDDSCRNYQSLSDDGKDAKNQSFLTNNVYKSAAFKVYSPMVCCRRNHSYLMTVAASPSFETY